MFCSRKPNNIINQVQEKALRLCIENENLTFGVRLTNKVTIRVKNFRSLQTKVFKCITGLSIPNLKNVFFFKENKPKELSTLKRNRNN